MIMTEVENDPYAIKILWSSISRNNTVVVEAGDDPFGGAVKQISKSILSRKRTPGWETCTWDRICWFGQVANAGGLAVPKLKAIKFHVYEHNSGDGEPSKEDCEPIVWSFAAVYNPGATSWEEPSLATALVKNFIQHMIEITESPRLTDPEWRTGSALACQDDFSSTLLQCMDEVTFMGKIAQIQQSVQYANDLMQHNVNAILEQEDRLREIEERSDKLQEIASTFQKNTKTLRRQVMLNNARYGVVVGSMVTGAVAVALIPTLVVVL